MECNGINEREVEASVLGELGSFGAVKDHTLEGG